MVTDPDTSDSSGTEDARVPLPEFLRGELFDPFDPEERPTGAWGMFEVIDNDGDLAWIERMTPGCRIEDVFAGLSGFLGDLERQHAWHQDDEDIADEDDETAEDTNSDESAMDQIELEERFDHLTFFAPRPGTRLSGRYVILILMSPDEDDESGARFCRPGLGDYELEGVLRTAQLRFTETLSWSDAEQEIRVPAPHPGEARFGDLFPGWQFPRLEAGVSLTSAWAVLDAEDGDGDEGWFQRHTPEFEVNRLVGFLSWLIAWTEETEVADWDAEEIRPQGPGRLRFDNVRRAGEPPADDEDEDDYDPTRRDAPLDPRLAQLRCVALPRDHTAVRAIVIAMGTDAEGDPHTYLAYAARPAWSEDVDVISNLEELGLLRSCRRDLLREQLG